VTLFSDKLTFAAASRGFVSDNRTLLSLSGHCYCKIDNLSRLSRSWLVEN